MSHPPEGLKSLVSFLKEDGKGVHRFKEGSEKAITKALS